ncbi:hypothetical protein KJ742_00930 [Patescibacteria group bacterium]|nr:hypothetical protein [Patescibacteria group bacterium]MBU1682487.1 hypothetical protein [Patescibacteria group bacterium]MBU1935273.1 hypothetical protein [Patescibacteria group bacterium]
MAGPPEQLTQQVESLDVYHEIHEKINTLRETIWQGIEISADDFANALGDERISKELAISFAECLSDPPILSGEGIRKFNELAGNGQIAELMRIFVKNYNDELYLKEKSFPPDILRILDQIKRDLRIVHYADITPKIGKGIFVYEGRTGERKVYTWSFDQANPPDPIDIELDEAEESLRHSSHGYSRKFSDMISDNKFELSPEQIDRTIDMVGSNGWGLRDILAYQEVDRFHIIRICGKFDTESLNSALEFAKKTNPYLTPELLEEFEGIDSMYRGL